jgi:hypothetical protein
MNRLVRFVITLLSHIIAQGRFISMLTNRTYVKSFSPKLSTPKQLLDFRHLPENLSGSYALDGLYHLLGTIPWYRLHQKMHVVLINTNLQKLYFVTLSYFQANIPNNSLHLLIKNHSSIFGWTNNVIDQYRNVVSLVYIFAHAP